MQRKHVTVPGECCSRPLEDLDSGNSNYVLRQKLNLNRHLWNFSSRFMKPYHFEDAADFLQHQSGLYKGALLVLPELEIKNINKDHLQRGRLDFLLGDSTGKIMAQYLWTSKIENDFLRYAEIGDKLRIYSALYEHQATIRIEDPFRVLNDVAYQRVSKRRAGRDKDVLERKVG
jgi:hypothetical protein